MENVVLLTNQPTSQPTVLSTLHIYRFILFFLNNTNTQIHFTEQTLYSRSFPGCTSSRQISLSLLMNHSSHSALLRLVCLHSFDYLSLFCFLPQYCCYTVTKFICTHILGSQLTVVTMSINYLCYHTIMGQNKQKMSLTQVSLDFFRS